MRWPRAALLAGCVVALSAAVSTSATPAAPASEHLGGQLAEAAERVAASAGEIGKLDSRNESDKGVLQGAGDRLAEAAAAAKAALETYRGAKGYYGTKAEAEQIDKMMGQLLESRARFGRLAGSPSPPPSASQQQAAQRRVDRDLEALIRRAVDARLGVAGLSDILTAPSLQKVRNGLVGELTGRLDRKLEQEMKRLTGIGFVPGVPLADQLRARAELELSRLLGRIAFASGPGGIVVQLLGARVVDIAFAALKEAFRGKGNLPARVQKTLAGFANRIKELEALSDAASERAARRAIAQAENAVGATKFLRSDLRRKPSGQNVELLNQLGSGEQALLAAIAAAKRKHHIDSPLEDINWNKAIGLATDIRSQVEALTKKLGGSPAAPTGAGWTGDWTWKATNDVTKNVYVGPTPMTIVQQGGTVCSVWSFSGGGSAKGGLSGDTWSGAKWYDGFGQGNWTLTLAADAKTFKGSQTIDPHGTAGSYTATILGTRQSSAPSQNLDCSTLKVGP